MSLISPGPSFGYWSDNLGTVSTDGITGYGTAVTPGTSNADGSTVTLLSALAHDCEYLVLAIYGFGGNSIDSSALLDIQIDPAGGTSWSALIDDLVCGFTSFFDYDNSTANTTTGVPLMYHFPLWIPAGSAVGARIRSAKATAYADTPRVIAYAAGGNKNPASWWCGQKVETVGTMSPSTSRGQAHTAGGSSSFSSWTSLGSATALRAGAAQWGVQGPGSGTVTAGGHTTRWEFGAGSTQIGPCLYRGMHSLEVGTHFFPGPIFCDIPAGTQMQVRAACNIASPQAIDVAAYLVQ